MPIKILVIAAIFIFSWFQTTSAGFSADTYYVWNAVECKYTVYICESGYKKFSHSRGCGCEKIFKNYSTTVDYNYSDTYYNNNYYSNNNSYDYRVITGAKNNNNFYSAREQDERLEAQKIVTTFISKLERSGYTHNEIVRATERIIQRLDDVTVTTAKQRTLIKYLKQDLRNYENDYEDSFDRIYDVFEYYY